MQLYRCLKCNYIYDPSSGDTQGGIKPNTPFENVPAGWVCPLCGAAKEEFVED